MANFPTSPAVGEQFSTSKVTYRWNGSAWDIVEGVKQGTVVESIAGGADVKLLLHAEDTTDSSMSAHSMTVGGVAVSATKKKFGSYSFSFDGTDDYLDCPVSSDLEIGTEDFTIEFWFNTTNGSADNWWRRIFSLKREGNVDNNLQIYINNSTNQLGVYKDSSNYADFGSAITDGNWHHVALVKYNGNFKTYIDGTCVWTVADTANYTNCQPRFGATGHENDNGNFDGYLDEIRITIGTAHYTADFTPSTTAFQNPSMAPVGNLQFTEGSEPDATAGVSTLYATSSGMFVKNSSGTVSPLVAGASATATSVELPSITSTPSAIASTGQMVHWDRSGESVPDANVKLLLTGDTSTDGSPSGHSISYNGSTTTSTEQAKYGAKSIKFSGSTVSIADSEDWNFGSGDWTAECWVYLNATGGQGIINQSNPGASSNSSMIIWLDGTVGIYVSSGTGWTYSNINSNSLSTGQWIHLAAVRYGTSLKMYVNGVATSSTTLPSGWSLGNSSLALELGAQAGGSTLNGYMDDVRITKSAQYTADFTPPTAQLTATTAADTTIKLLLNGEDMSDSSSGNANVTYTGTNPVSTTQKKYGNSSLKNSSDTVITVPASSDYDFGTNDFTISAWLYCQSAGHGNWGGLVSFTPYGDNDPQGYLHNIRCYDNTQELACSTSGGYIRTGHIMATNTWFHLAIVRESDNLKFYIDGSLVYTYALAAGLDFVLGNEGKIQIGQSWHDYYANTGYGPHAWDGYIDDFCIQSGAKWTENFTPPTSQLSAAGISGLYYVAPDGTTTLIQGDS